VVYTVVIEELHEDCFVTSPHSYCLQRPQVISFSVTYRPLNTFQVNFSGATQFVQQNPNYAFSWTSWAWWMKWSLLGCDWRGDSITAVCLAANNG